MEISTLTHGSFSRFILNGLGHINRIFGQEIFVEDEWRVIGEYVHDHTGGRHQASYSPKKPVMVMGSLVTPQDRIFVEQSLKYSSKESAILWTSAGFQQTDLWMKGSEYGKFLFYTSIFIFLGSVKNVRVRLSVLLPRTQPRHLTI